MQLEGDFDDLLWRASEWTRARRRTVLLVDDDGPFRALVHEYLRGAGYGVLEAGNVPEALRVLEHHSGPIDLLLTDVEMPGGSGMDLVQAMTRLRPLLAVILMSGGVRLTSTELATLPGRASFLEKPFTRTGLLDAIHRVAR